MLNKFIKKSAVLLSIVTLLAFTASACSSGETTPATPQEPQKPVIIFADADWDSIRFHNSVAAFIIENGYGYETDVTPGSTQITFAALEKGDINAYMEVWSANIATYDAAIESGNVLELSLNFGDNDQGLYVPTYVIKGDPSRNIEPMAPDLKTVKDLKKYADIFKDPEDKDMGVIYGSIPGWAADEILFGKYEAYGLNEMYNYMRPGSDGALSASITAAYEKGEPWVGYYWEPTWVMGKYDMTLLEDDPYDEERFAKGYGKFPSVEVTVCVNKILAESAPDVVEFLRNYKTSSAITSAALSYMMDNEADHDTTAKWWLQENQDLWTGWLTEEATAKVLEALK